MQYKGDKLTGIDESEVSYNSSNQVQDGTPTGYFIRNNAFHLNYKPDSGSIKLTYYGTVDGIQDASDNPSPIIPSMYHRDLCNYAIAVASAISSPQLHDKYMMMWHSSIDEIINEDANRELIGHIKREV